MSTQPQNQDQDQTTEVKIGFGSLLNDLIPSWENSQHNPAVRGLIEVARNAYQRGINDMAMIVNQGLGQMQHGEVALRNTMQIAQPVSDAEVTPAAEAEVEEASPAVRDDLASCSPVDELPCTAEAMGTSGTTYPMEVTDPAGTDDYPVNVNHAR